MKCSHVVHLDPYGQENRMVYYCHHDAGHEGPHENEKRPGNPRQETNRTAQEDTQEGASTMPKSIELSTENQTNEAMNALLDAATGLTLHELQWYLRNSISLSSEMAWDRLWRGHDWTIHDLVELGELWDVRPSTLVAAVLSVAEGVEPEQVISQYDLDRRPFIIKGGEEA